MQAGRDRLQALQELVARLNGVKDVAHNSTTFGSKFNVRGNGTVFTRLPSRSLIPPVDYDTGDFFYMVDYSYVDGDDVVR